MHHYYYYCYHYYHYYQYYHYCYCYYCNWRTSKALLLLLLNWWELWDWSHFTLDLGLPSIIHPTLLFFKCAGPCACLCLCAGACGGGIGHTHGGFLRPGYVFVTTDEPTDNLIREWRGVVGGRRRRRWRRKSRGRMRREDFLDLPTAKSTDKQIEEKRKRLEGIWWYKIKIKMIDRSRSTR